MSTTVQARPVPNIVTELPGPKARAHIEFDHAWTSPSLPRAYPIVPVRGQGCAVEDIDGNVFLDFAAGIAVNSTGHAHPRVVEAIAAQAAELIHFSASDFYLPIYARAAERLARIAPMRGPNRVFIGNSGAEAVEAGLKLARYHTRRPNVVAFLGAFHGRTMGAVSLTAQKAKYHAHFGPLLPGVYHVPFGSAGLDELEQRVFKRLMPADEFAAVIVEPIQGEGGYVVPDAAFFPRLREICDRHGILLIADEVQSGAGRTGKMWAIEHFGVEPDILLDGQGDRLGDADRGDDREGRGHGLDHRRARLHVRWQPRRAGRHDGDDRPPRGGPHRERGGTRRAGAAGPAAAASSTSRTSSATCGARAS